MKYIPNTITCLNLFSGCLAIIMALKYESYSGAFFFIALALVFDFLDGFTARLLNAKSAIGVQLDSLADTVSFGVAPGVIIYTFLNNPELATYNGFRDIYPVLPWFAFLIPIFSALRLAKFNIDTRQTKSFLGLPVPADALFWSALILSLHTFPASGFLTVIIVIIPILITIFCWMMISEIPMFSLKFKNYTWRDNKLPYIQIFATIGLIVGCYLAGLNSVGVSLSIVFYILLSLFSKP
jgi:CDP-diacylglycerol--serine O-phosphatidyltransferase